MDRRTLPWARAAAAVARADRVLAVLAFLLTVTALLLPWWRVTWDDGTVETRDDVFAFRPEEPLTTWWAPHLTGAMAGLAALGLFVRLAADSHTHEPRTWRRDLGIQAGTLLLAAASCLLWPAAVRSFWGGRNYEDGGIEVVETAMPGLGWWLAVLAGLLGLVAFWKAGRYGADGAATPHEDAERSTAPGGTQK